MPNLDQLQLNFSSAFVRFVRPMRHRMEDKILRLCRRAISEQDPDEFAKIVVELRAALHAHIETLRK